MEAHNTVRVEDAWMREARERAKAAPPPKEGAGASALEWRATWTVKPLSRQAVDRFHAYCRATAADFEELPRKQTLRIIAGGKHYEFEGDDAITTFLRRQPASLFDGNRVVDTADFGDPMPLPEYYVSVALTREERAPATSDEAALADTHKRFENTVVDTYAFKGAPDLRLEAVARGVCRGYALSAAFDTEFELHASSGSLETCLRGAGLLNKIITATPFLLGRSAELAVTRAYLELAHPGKPPVATLEDAQKDAKKLLAGPKPVTLEQRHVTGPNSIFIAGYAVCDKTDGERALLFVDAQGDAFLLTTGLRVRATGLHFKAEGARRSVIDGEHVATRDAPALLRFMVFDVYWAGGVDVRGQTLAERLALAPRFATAGGGLRVEPKTFLGLDAKDDDMHEACASLLTRARDEGPAGFSYRTDGLVFTPLYAPVKDLANNLVLKWKPPEQNTIDFLVEQNGAGAPVVAPNGRSYAAFTLYTGFNEASGDFGNITDVLQQLYTNAGHVPTGVNFYSKRPFRPALFYENHMENAMVPVADGVPVCEDGTPVRHGTIVEFAYGLNTSRVASYNWRALRCREDKTLAYASNNRRIGGAANDYRTALSVWKSIHLPVTEAMLRGDEAVSADLTNYYEDVGERRKSHVLAMLKLHNAIKEQMYADVVARLPPARKTQAALAELACGKGGDLYKWVKAGFSVVFGVDSNRDCIMNGLNGAYRRLVDAKAERQWSPARSTIVFAVADCSEPFAGEGAPRDAQSGMLLSVVMGQKAPGSSAYLARLHNRGNGNGGFDVVSAQFAVHYMFSSVDRARVFMQNVTQLLRPGGFFIGTCMDGDMVHAMLEDAPGGVRRGTVGASPNLTTIWEVARKYEELAPYGSIVDVYLERTGHVIPEPLVRFDVFVALAKNYHLTLVESKPFEDFFGTTGDDLSADEKSFSALNRTFVFQKRAVADAPPPPEEQEGGEPEAEEEEEEIKSIVVSASAAKTSFLNTGGESGEAEEAAEAAEDEAEEQ